MTLDLAILAAAIALLAFLAGVAVKGLLDAGERDAAPEVAELIAPRS